jgi:hypothetical protein
MPGLRQPIRCAKDVTGIIGNTVLITRVATRERISPKIVRSLGAPSETFARPVLGRKNFKNIRSAGALNCQPARFTNMFQAGPVCPYLDLNPVPSCRFSD